LLQFRLFYRLGLLVVLCLGSLSATIVDTPLLPFDFTTSDFNGNLQQFDPSLGTLTSVALGFNPVRLNFTLHASISGSGPVSIFSDFNLGSDVTLPGVFLSNDIFAFELQFGCSGTDSCSIDTPFADIGGGTNQIFPSPDLTAYIGTGTLPLTLTPEIAFPNTNSSPSGGDVHFASQEIFGNVFLEYTYTPADASIPEPSAMLLMGSGLGLLAWRRWRPNPK